MSSAGRFRGRCREPEAVPFALPSLRRAACPSTHSFPRRAHRVQGRRPSHFLRPRSQAAQARPCFRCLPLGPSSPGTVRAAIAIVAPPTRGACAVSRGGFVRCRCSTTVGDSLSQGNIAPKAEHYRFPAFLASSRPHGQSPPIPAKDEVVARPLKRDARTNRLTTFAWDCICRGGGSRAPHGIRRSLKLPPRPTVQPGRSSSRHAVFRATHASMPRRPWAGGLRRCLAPVADGPVSPSDAPFMVGKPAVPRLGAEGQGTSWDPRCLGARSHVQHGRDDSENESPLTTHGTSLHAQLATQQCFQILSSANLSGQHPPSRQRAAIEAGEAG